MGWIKRLFEWFKKSEPVFPFIKPARRVSRVFLHCSASDYPAHDNVATIRKWHLARNFSDIGYHYYIDKAGAIHAGRPLHKIPAAQSGHNTGTIAICLGGFEDFTPAQFASLKRVCKAIDDAYESLITFHGHNEVSNKACPVYPYKGILMLDKQGGLGL